LPPCLDGLSPVLNDISTEKSLESSTKSNDSGDIEHTGDSFDILEEEKKREEN
jgi:hypothetical protein